MPSIRFSPEGGSEPAPLVPGRLVGRPRVLVLGDLMLDVVLASSGPLASGTDVPGQVALRQGGSAAASARWFARLGARTTLVCAVGRDAIGRSLVRAVRDDGVVVRAFHASSVRTGRIGVVVTPDGERSFVADRGAADLLAPEHLALAWFQGLDHLHLPAYSLLGDRLGAAGRRSVELARAEGATVSVDVASVRPLLSRGRGAALELLRDVAPDVLLATASEAEALAGRGGIDRLAQVAPTIVLKRGSKGATVLGRQDDAVLRFEVATRPLPVTDTTGAGDAFDAGFVLGWLAGVQSNAPRAGALRRAAVAGHRAAARQLASERQELHLG